MIAAIGLANGLTVVTHNTAEFSRVIGLGLEDCGFEVAGGFFMRRPHGDGAGCGRS
ncbi:MAG TPA: hypothetical protein VG013_02770 [Gemmataceae bacterium]|jgi:hypothetical protein|nr:hypothetical protein [Gemmataceae bacterium]